MKDVESKRLAETRIDWLTLVYDVHNGSCEFEDIMQSLKVYDSFMWKQCKPINHYSICYYLADASIIVGEKVGTSDEEGHTDVVECMIQFSGTGLSMYSEYLSDHFNLSIVGMLKRQLENYDVSVSRIDVATDFYNYDYHYSPLYLYQQSKYEHNLVTKTRSVKFVDSFPSTGVSYLCDDFKTFADSSEEGTTLYIGKNPKQLRIYNKKAERQQKIGAVADCDSWYRWEYQLNGDRAKEFIKLLQEQSYDLSYSWLVYLADHVRFIEHVGHQEKRSRYPNATWFNKLVKPVYDNEDTVPIVKSCTDYSYPSMVATLDWFTKGGVVKRLNSLIETRKRQYLAHNVSSEKDALSMATLYVTKQLSDVYVEHNGDIDESLIDYWSSNREDIDKAVETYSRNEY